MASSRATTVEAYLDELPPERRAVVTAVRELVRRNLPEGYAETMNWGMISYELPLERYPTTHNGQPLMFAAIAAQKHHYSLYLTCADPDGAQERQLRDAFAAAGKKLDMGKSCVRFRKLDDIEPEAIGTVIAASPPDTLIERYEATRGR